MADVLALFVGQKKKALESYARAIDEFPDYSGLKNAYFNSGMLYYELNNPNMAARSFKAYVQLFPEAPRRFTARYMLDRIKEEGRTGSIELDTQDLADEQKSQPLVRVSLSKNFPVSIILETKATISASGRHFSLDRGEYSISFSRGNFSIAGKQLGPKAAIDISKGFELTGKNYAGDILLIKENNKPVLVNRLPIGKYLLGVVPKEMSPSWELQALEAQAIAARSYAYYIVLKNKDKSYDVASTTASQVYGGADAGSEKSDQAVRETAGSVLTYEGKPVLSYFHAHSGGKLEDSGLVWTTSLPYYKVKNDKISEEYKPLAWNLEVSASEIRDSLRENGFSLNSIKNILPVEYSASGRITQVKIITDQGPLKVNSNSLRIWLGAGQVKSTLCKISKKGDRYIFYGRGYGHGVGMSQWGAQGMAARGYDFREILAHYYPGTKLRRLW